MSSEQVSQQPDSNSGGPVSREEMYAEVWRLPMTKIADHHRVSSSFLARVCTRMNVPRPPRGHWVKLENGIPSLQPPLPEAGPGDLQVWCGFHTIRPPSPRSSGQAFHGHLATCSTAIRPGSRSAATQGWHC
ncbi:hypothetical protein DZC76_12150 [Pseudomonas sp. phDV1]|nr:hypothetical protein DZC76_12150 [Pseudomonas sp. phDV1]